MEENRNTPEEKNELKSVTAEAVATEVVSAEVIEKQSPILTTEDKVEIFKGDTFFQVELQTAEITERVERELDAVQTEWLEINGKRVPKYLFFSTRDLAIDSVYKKYIIQGKEVQLRKSAMDQTLASAVVLMNVLGKPYWEELKKVFTVGEPTLSTINGVFE